MKKYPIIIILALLVIFACVTTAFANTQTSAYSVSDVKVAKGESFSIVVSLENNPGIISLKFKVNYDETLLSLDSVEDLGLLKGYNPPAPEIGSPYTLRWLDSTAVEDSVASGELIRLNFTAIASEEVDTAIEIIHGESYNFSGKKVEFASSEAKVEIRNKYTVKFLDDDGETVIFEKKYFADETVTLPENPTKSADRENKYIFTAWTPEFSEKVTEDVTYTANYDTVALSDDATLSSISIDGGTLSPEFDSSVTEYFVTLDHTHSSLDAEIVTSNEFATYTVKGGDVLRVGQNTVEITVMSEKGNIAIYTILVTKLANPDYVEDSDSSIKEIKPSAGVLTPVFDSQKTEYILYVENSTSEITFTCLPNSEKAESVSPADPMTFTGESAEITLFCVAESGARTEYKIKIVRLPAYGDGEIPGFVFPSDPPAAEDDGGVTDQPRGGNSSEKNVKISKTTVIIIVAVASALALASLVGIILLVVSSKKAAKKS